MITPPKQAELSPIISSLSPLPLFHPLYDLHVVTPFLKSILYVGERPVLPMIDPYFSKEGAIPPHIWGLLFDWSTGLDHDTMEYWEQKMQEDGLSVFLQGYEQRGPNNERKRIYFSALTPDLYESMYKEKVKAFFEQLLSPQNAGKPLMHEFYQHYFDLYWDLHLGVTGADIPDNVRQIGKSFNTVIGYWVPMSEIVYKNYMLVRELRQPLKNWINQGVQAVIDRKVADPQKTFVYYWLKNGEEGENFRRKDIAFECFHNFLAFNQWGNTLYHIMTKLVVNDGDQSVKQWFEKTMQNPDQPDTSAFTPLDRFVMELFRTISPNEGSLSSLTAKAHLGEIYSKIITLHAATSEESIHWRDPDKFNPDRYLNVPTSDQNDAAKCTQIGLSRCPFNKEAFAVKDGRQVEVTNSAFGAVYSVVDRVAHPVLDDAGYAPFGFGYRRCAGELFTVNVIKEFLRQVWQNQISFQALDLPSPEKVPVGPATVIEDNIAFTTPAV